MKMNMLCAALDFGGTTPWNPLASPASLIPGPQKGKVIEVDPGYNGGKSTKILVDLTEGSSAGHQADLYIGNEPGEKGGNTRKWFQACACVAPDADAFVKMAKEKGLKFDPTIHAKDTFMNKTIHIVVTAVPGTNVDSTTGLERPNLPDKEFITPAQYAALVAAEKSRPTPAPAAGNSAASTTHAAAPAAAPAAQSGDVLASLFGPKAS